MGVSGEWGLTAAYGGLTQHGMGTPKEFTPLGAVSLRHGHCKEMPKGLGNLLRPEHFIWSKNN